jgi:prepilin-type N-terminal cleavage/methylation domain-containing protein
MHNDLWIKLSGTWERSGSPGNKGFTFLEVMVVVVILAVGITGIYRAFLQSLRFQDHLLIRLHTINVLSDEFARAENALILGQPLNSSSLGEPSFTAFAMPRFSIQRFQTLVLNDDKNFLYALGVRVLWDQGGKDIEFTRSSLVYAHD